MKIRQGFVSNSSSSSFCLATKKKKDFKLTITVSLDSLIKKVVKNESQLMKYLEDERGWVSDRDSWNKYETDEYNKYCKVLSEDKVLMFGGCSSEDDDGTSRFLYSEGFPSTLNDDYEVIQNTGE